MLTGPERLKRRHGDKVVARHIVRFAMPLPNVGTSRTQELVSKHVPRVGITHTHRLPGSDAIGQTVALIDVENSVFAQHRYQATFGFLAVAVLHLQLLDKVD